MSLKRPFELETINIYDAGQEQCVFYECTVAIALTTTNVRWRGKFKYEIPVLMMKGRIQAKGRWGESEIMKALEAHNSLKESET